MMENDDTYDMVAIRALFMFVSLVVIAENSIWCPSIEELNWRSVYGNNIKNKEIV